MTQIGKESEIQQWRSSHTSILVSLASTQTCHLKIKSTNGALALWRGASCLVAMAGRRRRALECAFARLAQDGTKAPLKRPVARKLVTPPP